MRVLVLNAGSATAKAALVEVLGGKGRVRWRKSRALEVGSSAEEAFDALLEECVALGEAIGAVGHRVVHGGARFREPVRVDASVEAAIAELSRLAPLHNPRALDGLKKARERWPGQPMVAVFDTAFHAAREPESLRYPLEWALGEELELLRYGFHGIAHASLLEKLAEARGSSVAETSAVTLQLGAGCSACAVDRGRSIETSMGFSPLGGLPMATRTGDLDPGVLLELFRSGMNAAAVEELVTRRSGFFGMAGSADLREVLALESAGNERARIAVALFVRRIVELVGAYFTLLRGRGALVFGGGIGTHSAEIRRRVAAGLEAWGIELDEERNGGDATGRISMTASREVHVFETDEETLIAESVERVLLTLP